MIETGGIYHISQNELPTGHEIWSNRPGIVISSNESLQTEGTVKIVYVSSKDRNRPNSVRISDKSFFHKNRGKKYREHIALCSQIHTVDKCRLESFYGKVSGKELKEIESAVKQTLF
ncbi:hypothetical protein C804_03499 [Lachnospiraceae bacterium A4]|nr:hypothetical protein C804_03499 [Lachnospiraceae bacterium A4]